MPDLTSSTKVPLRDEVPGHGRAEPFAAAIGGATTLTRRQLRVRQSLLAVALLLSALGLYARQALKPPLTERLPTVGNVAWVIEGRVMRGGHPRDIDLASLRDLFGVRAVVDLEKPSPVAPLAPKDFSLNYLSLPVGKRVAPSQEQLAQLLRFIKAQRGAVYVYDQTGVESAPTVAAMLLVLRGTTAPRAVAEVAGEARAVPKLFRAAQLAAIDQLAYRAGLGAGPPDAGRGRIPDYPDARRLRW